VTTFSINDTQNMGLALKLARQGALGVAGNPMVGCVIEKEGKIIASGYHQIFGEAHAEINALNQIAHQANGATLYVTLEPCSHHGKTPPCAQAIINSGAKKVVIATLDPNPLVSGQGVSMLRTAGIDVLVGLLEDQAIALNRGFIKRMKSKRPFVTCKIAMSLDGKTSMLSGQSKWITADSARIDVQKLRGANQAIMTGSGTVLADNPSLTIRLEGNNATPVRVIVDSKNQITDKSLNIFSEDAPTQVFNAHNTHLNNDGKIELIDVLMQLGAQGINSVLLEAGPGLIGAMIEQQLIDEFIIYTAPILMGSDANSMALLPIKSLSNKINLNISDLRMVGNDIRITATINS
jgi:diaminohydroxyphosphoribosylaminopyrimidine deaminase / 5-amino-6-(5-phosphoribosylamino)uracil reductase